MSRARPLVTIDGPAGAGKSTVSRALAARLGFTYLDTGALYRTVALCVLEDPELASSLSEAGIARGVEERLGTLTRGLDIRFGDAGTRVWVGDREVTGEIRTPAISQAASRVSAVPAVREGLLDLQRRLAAEGGVVAEGRDVGTVVFPGADVKFYLTADVGCRAERRAAELRARGVEVDLAATRREIEERDARDEGREAAPLRRPEGAIEVDSGPLTADEVLTRMAMVVRSREGS